MREREKEGSRERERDREQGRILRGKKERKGKEKG